MSKYKLTIAYDGKAFYGFQTQPDIPTVEGELLKAVKTIFSDVTTLSGSGRTDTGVHAEEQVVHFKTNKIFDKNRICYSLNQLLADSIWIKHIEETSESFDARRSATSREYRYLFKYGEIPLYLRDRMVKVGFQPDEDIMNQFSSILEGEHDFKCFRNEGSNENTTVRNMIHFSITKKKLSGLYDELDDHYYEAKIVANGFLYRMVRHIMGAIFEVLKGKQTLQEFKNYFEQKENTFTYKVSPGHGLTLAKVRYEQGEEG